MAHQNSAPEFGNTPVPIDSTMQISKIAQQGDFAESAEPIEGELSPADEAIIAALPSRSAVLVALRGPNLGARFLLSQDSVVAGRSAECDIFLDDVTVSRRHAEFIRQGTQFAVRDVGSLNGTYVQRVLVEGTILSPGDEVQIGKYRLTFFPSPLDQ